MILVLAGTQDGREISRLLVEAGYSVMVSVTTEYGQELAAYPGLAVNCRPLDEDGMVNLIRERRIRLLLDASHPYAANVSQNAMAAAARSGIRYVRYERPAVPLPAYEKLYVVPDASVAAERAALFGKVVFLTTGSRWLKIFKESPFLQSHRLIARVLPEPAVLADCLQWGYKPGDIIAMQGPFSHELNVALFRAYGARAVVMKNSGRIGGSDTKITAAMELALPLLVIDRPALNYQEIVHSIEDAIHYVREVIK
ncbi:precorrin-6x reductase [Lucifera butyrica]|uniref:Precorrin-6x reductase n=1 Tax=Lucifera butyrica TaxID=1351585 RepID=A0A498R2H6_9FIRM|nr:precorrin-6A reductase [Lucifera butyrica]VBB06836.1 precorrin-6x reductase [Lucifera butyrica]